MNSLNRLMPLKLVVCCATTLWIHADFDPAQRTTTIIGQNVGGGANNFLEFAITTGNKPLDDYRKGVAEDLAPETARLRTMSDEEILKTYGTKSRKDAEKIAANNDLTRGPSIRAVLPKSMRLPIVEHVRRTSGQVEADKVNQIFDAIHYTNFGDEKAFSTFCLTSGFLGAEKNLMDAEKKHGIQFNVPTLDNPSVLVEGPTREEAKLAVFKAILSRQAIAATDTKEIEKNVSRIQETKVPAAFKNYPAIYQYFQSPAGYNFLYGAQQATLEHTLFAQDSALKEFNHYKQVWKNSAGDLDRKNKGLLDPVLQTHPDVYCTQEASTEYIDKVEKTDKFLSVKKQPTGDGSHIFLNKNNFNGYQVIPLDNYKKYNEANALLVHAHRIGVRPYQGPIELFGTFHASSRNPQDRLDAMKAFAEKAREINAKTGRVVVLRLQGDANTDSQEKVTAFIKHCSEHGFKETSQALGQDLVATVAKMRVFSSQKEKEFKPDRNTKDFNLYLVIGADDADVTKATSDLTGFQQPYDPNRNLPDAECPADHYPKIATFEDNF